VTKAVYILTLNKDINSIFNLKVYKLIVFIYLLLLVLLSLLNSIISDFLSTIYLFNKLNYFVLQKLLINTYKFIYNKLGLIKAYIKDIA
jgi:hypothetical protein